MSHSEKGRSSYKYKLFIQKAELQTHGESWKLSEVSVDWIFELNVKIYSQQMLLNLGP